MLTPDLPIAAIRPAFTAALLRGRVVLSSPTGSGKSTEVPRWCPGKVLVVEPRRIACRSLAMRVAELEGTRLGDGVGYLVRDERVASDATRILFATPGMVLRNRALLQHADTVILDEFHERSLETDLLFALLVPGADAATPFATRPAAASLVVMSATLDGERIAEHLSGIHIAAEGRTFPVDIRYLAGSATLPDEDNLPSQLRRALTAAADDPGDILVFLPGKSEIEACAQALSQAPYSVLRLHGGLSLDEQRRAFASTPKRKVILATNVAETSLTIPGIGVVIDSGLVRQTRYQAGRGFLALVPIAEDSAAQRAGRAGRTAKGVCYRLWSQGARLEKRTLPELHRESLVPLVLGAAAWGARAEDLPWLDAPKPYALLSAREDLQAWGALDVGGALSEGGRGLFSLPVSPLHARLLVSAQAEGCLDDMIDLVSALSVGRPLFLPGAFSDEGVPEGSAPACDVTAIVRAMRALTDDDRGLSRIARDEARQQQKRLRRHYGLKNDSGEARAIDREALVRAALAADPRIAHVARLRGKELAFSNGGTEITLARESALHRLRALEAVLVLDTRAFGTGRDARVLITCGMAVTPATLARAGLGSDTLSSVQLVGKRVVSCIERVYAGRVLSEREDTPSGALLRAALVTLLERGSLFRDAVAKSRERLSRTALAAALAARGHPAGIRAEGPVPELSAWLLSRLEALGLEEGEDLPLLSAADVLAPELPYEARTALDQDFPSTVSVGDASYRAEYDVARFQVLLQMVKGNRQDPPKLAYLPRFPGMRICVSGPRGMTVLRERGP